MEQNFELQCKGFLENEKTMKQNTEILQKYSEELEKDRTNERTLRLKLEEEYMQNSKNHEEEVQLRLKFESKLNSMHSMHRELDIKHKRVLQELAGAQMTLSRNVKMIEEQTSDIIALKALKIEQDAKLELLAEKKATLERDFNHKNITFEDLEARFRRTQYENDLTKYQLHE